MIKFTLKRTICLFIMLVAIYSRRYVPGYYGFINVLIFLFGLAYLINSKESS